MENRWIINNNEVECEVIVPNVPIGNDYVEGHIEGKLDKIADVLDGIRIVLKGWRL